MNKLGLYAEDNTGYNECFQYIKVLHPILFHNFSGRLKLEYVENIFLGPTIIDFICENNLMYQPTESIITLWKLEIGE
jgi:hypothetical protein